MPRTDATAVQSAIDTSLTTTQVNAFIADASAWVDVFLANQGLTADTLERIEKYLACHFVTLRDPRLSGAKADDIDERYQRAPTITEYLKAAAALDPTGTVEDQFIAATGRPKARWTVGAGYA